MAPPALHRGRWLSGNGSFELAARTVDIAFTFDRDCVFSLVESPESNGIALALVNIFKRDLVGVAFTHRCRLVGSSMLDGRPQSRPSA